jgi:ornithine--oxo-acid transaminase
MILGKALGGGVYPVSAILADDDVMKVFTPGTHGSTFGGNPLAAAVGIAALSVLVEENLAHHAHTVGTWFINHLRAIHAPAVEQIRGRGLLVGVVLRKEAGPARPYCEALMRRGILAKETHERVIRFAPPLIVKRQQLEEVLPAIGEVLLQERAVSAPG